MWGLVSALWVLIVWGVHTRTKFKNGYNGEHQGLCHTIHIQAINMKMI